MMYGGVTYYMRIWNLRERIILFSGMPSSHSVLMHGRRSRWCRLILTGIITTLAVGQNGKAVPLEL